MISTPTGWDASPLQGYPPVLNITSTHYTSGKRIVWKKYSVFVFPKNTTKCFGQGLIGPGPLNPYKGPKGHELIYFKVC